MKDFGDSIGLNGLSDERSKIGGERGNADSSKELGSNEYVYNITNEQHVF